jgi:hypothetical protein
MAAAVIGALRVVLGADTAALEKGLKQASSSLSTFGTTMAKGAAAVTAAFATMATGVGAAVKHALNEADKLGKMAQSIGIPVEELSGLKHAADLSGVSIEALGKSVAKLSRTMLEAAANPASEAAKSFQALGISVKNADGSLKSSSTVLTEVAGRFENMTDGVGKTAIAYRLFGRGAAEIIPLLNAGKKGLEDMIQEARDLGLVIDEKTAKSAEAFNDNLTRLTRVMNGIAIQVASHMAPGLERLSGRLVQISKDTDLVKSASNFLIGTFENLLFIVSRLRLEWTLATNEFIALKNVFTTVTISQMTEAWTEYQRVQKDSDAALKAFHENWEKSGRAAVLGGDQVAAGAKKGAGAMQELNVAALGAENALQKYIKSTQASMEKQTVELASIGLSIAAKEKLKIVTGGLMTAQQNNIVVTEAMRAKLHELGNQAADTALKLEGARLKEETLLPWEKYEQQIKRINELLAAGAISQETYARASRKAADEAGLSWRMASESIAGSFTELAGAVGDSQSGIAQAAKIFAAAVAFINVALAQTYALAAPFPANLVAAAMIAAKGAVLLAAIKGAVVPAKPKGAAMGGTFQVPGGMSAVDNKFVPLNLAAGERVEITPAMESDRARQPTEVNLTVPNEMISREYMRKMLDQMNAMLRDGYKINLAPA